MTPGNFWVLRHIVQISTLVIASKYSRKAAVAQKERELGRERERNSEDSGNVIFPSSLHPILNAVTYTVFFIVLVVACFKPT